MSPAAEALAEAFRDCARLADQLADLLIDILEHTPDVPTGWAASAVVDPLCDVADRCRELADKTRRRDRGDR